MAATARQGFVFGIGLVVGVLAGASILAGFQGHGLQEAEAAAPAAAGPSPFCGFEPLLPAKPQLDKFGVPMDAAGKAAQDAAAYLAVGDDMAKQGRARDAEIAYITACRIAGQFKGADSVEVAQAKFHLANHYSEASGTAGALPSLRDGVLQRAQALLSDSFTAYGAKLGVTHEKTALAAGSLARVKAAMLEGQEPTGVPRVLLAERSSPDYGVAMVNTAAMGAAPERQARSDEAAPPAEQAVEAAKAPAAAPAPAPVAVAAPKPPNAPVCLGGDCPAQERLVREREIERDPVPAAQASRQLPAPTRSSSPQFTPPAPSQATGSASGAFQEP